MYKKTEAARKKQQREEGLSDSDDEETEFEGGLKVPGKLWSKLFGWDVTASMSVKAKPTQTLTQSNICFESLFDIISNIEWMQSF